MSRRAGKDNEPGRFLGRRAIPGLRDAERAQ